MRKIMTSFDMEQIPVSEKLKETVEEAFLEIERENEAGNTQKKNHKKHWITAAGTAAAVVCMVGFLAANPAMAARLPFIGSIFAAREDNFTVPGDYSEQAQVINEVAAEETASEKTEKTEETGQPEEDTVITAEAVAAEYQNAVWNNGIAIIPVETYSDGVSLFVSIVIYSEQTLNEQAGAEGKITLSKYYLATGEGVVDEDVTVAGCPDFDAFVIDAHRVGGMMKFDLPESLDEDEHSLTLEIRSLRADMDDEDGNFISNIDHIMDCAIQHQGPWELSVPFDVDSEALEVYADLNPEGTENGVEKVVVSRYQLQVAYRQDLENAQVVCFDQDGNPLEFANDQDGTGFDTFKWTDEKPEKITAYVINTSPIITDSPEDSSYYTKYIDENGKEQPVTDTDGNLIGTVWAPKVKDVETAERFMLTKTEIVLE